MGWNDGCEIDIEYVCICRYEEEYSSISPVILGVNHMESQVISKYYTSLLGIMVILSGMLLFHFTPSCSKAAYTVNEAKLNFTAHKQGSVFSVAWSPNGEYIVSGGEDMIAIVWDSVTGSPWLTYDGHDNSVLSVDWDPNNNRIVSSSSDRKVIVWDPTTGGNLSSYLVHSDAVKNVAWSPDGRRVATASQDHTARIWDLSSNTTESTFMQHNDIVNSVSWSPDGSRIVSGGNDNRIRIWDPSNGTELTVLTGHGDSVMSVAWSDDGTKIVSGSLDNTAKVWDVATGELLMTYYGHDGGVLSVSWFQDGKRMVSGSEDNTIRVWDVGTGETILEYTAHKDIVRSVALSPDEGRIVSGSADHTARIWNLNIPPPSPELIVPSVILPRSSTAVLRAEVNNYLSSPEQLTPEFQYKPRTSSVWNDQYLSNPEYDNDQWQIGFTPGVNASLGPYDIRVRVKDSEQLSSPWTIETGSIEVANNLPSAVIWFAPTNVYRGEEATINVAVSDVETSPGKMLVSVECTPDAMDDWSAELFSSPSFNATSGMWENVVSFPVTVGTGEYRCRARCADKSLGVSPWDYLPSTITVMNNPPTIHDIQVDPPTVLRGESTRIWLGTKDIEEGDTVTGIKAEIKGPISDWVSIDFTYNAQGNNYSAVYHTFGDNEVGYYEVRVMLQDSEGIFTEWRSFTDAFNIVNNPPNPVDDHKEFSLYGDKSEMFDLTNIAIDFEDAPSSLTWEIDHSPSQLFTAEMHNSTWIKIIPSTDMGIGEGWIRLNVTDPDGDSSFKVIYIKTKDPLDRPDIEVLLNSPIDTTVVGDSSIMLSWDISYAKAPVKYDVHWGDSGENLSLLYRGLNETEVIVTDLIDGDSYWWKVTARIHNIPYTFQSAVWSFSVQMGFIPEHMIELGFARDFIELDIGEDIWTNLTLFNKGNVPEDVELSVRGSMEEYVTIADYVKVDPGQKIDVPIRIHAYESILPGKYVLTVKITYSNLEKTERMDIQMGEEKESTDGLAGLIPYITAIVVVVFLLGEVIYFFAWTVRKRKKEKLDDITPVPVYLSPYDSSDGSGAGDMYMLDYPSYSPETGNDAGFSETPPTQMFVAPQYMAPLPQQHALPMPREAGIAPGQQLLLSHAGNALEAPHYGEPMQDVVPEIPLPTAASVQSSFNDVPPPRIVTEEFANEMLGEERQAYVPQTSPSLSPENHPESVHYAAETASPDTGSLTADAVPVEVELSLEEELADLKALVVTVINKERPLESLASLGKKIEKREKAQHLVDSDLALQRIDERLALLDSLCDNGSENGYQDGMIEAPCTPPKTPDSYSLDEREEDISTYDLTAADTDDDDSSLTDFIKKYSPEYEK